MLCDCTPVQNFVLIDNQSFRLKADRFTILSKRTQERQDLAPPRCKTLKGVQAVGFGRHIQTQSLHLTCALFQT